MKGSWVETIAREASGFTPVNNLFPDWEKTSSRTEEAERTTGALNAYDRRALMPMRPTTGRAKLRRPMTAVALDVFDPDSAPGVAACTSLPSGAPKGASCDPEPPAPVAPVHESRYHRAAPISP